MMALFGVVASLYSPSFSEAVRSNHLGIASDVAWPVLMGDFYPVASVASILGL